MGGKGDVVVEEGFVLLPVGANDINGTWGHGGEVGVCQFQVIGLQLHGCLWSSGFLGRGWL